MIHTTTSHVHRNTRDQKIVRPSFASLLDKAIDRGVGRLLETQHATGYWWARLESNVTITAEYLFLTHFLGVPQRDRWQRIARHLLAQQNGDGGWSLYAGGPSDLNATVESCLALKLTGTPADASPLRLARQRALALGGIEGTRVFTRVWLALLGEYDWEGLPAIPPEIMLLPGGAPLSIYAFASWARQTVAAMTILFARKPVRPLPEGVDARDLWASGRPHRVPLPPPGRLASPEAFFFAFDRVLKAYEALPFKPGRAQALARAERWVLDRQEADGSWGGIQPPWVYSLMGLHALGYPVDHPVIAKGLEGFETFGVEEGDTWWMQSCLSPVWDTALAMNALLDAGVPGDHPALVRAGERLLVKQVRHPGDWQLRRPGTPPGGWSFEFANGWYPDTDDTAEILMALRRVRFDDPLRAREIVDRGFRWLVEMQSANGGWASFDADATGRLVEAIPFCDFGEVTDPPSEDVTAHAIECLASFGYDRAFPAVARGIAYLRQARSADGAWFGRWGVNWIYGTGAVLPALAAAGEGPHSDLVRKGALWLESVQNDDGGWGESCASYTDPARIGRGESTASQTAWALMGLIAAGRAEGKAVRRGIKWLLGMQRPDGSWPEPQYTGTGFPGDFMLRYGIYSQVFPVMALGRYRATRGAGR